MIVAAEGRTWEWPDADVECRAVVFGEYVSLKRAYPFLKGSRTAIQAGGNMGAFPWKMAQKFAAVITAEPDPECFRCLDLNVKERNVTKLNVAFGEPTMAVDTHIFRVSNRTGLAPGKNVREVEDKLVKVIPAEFLLDAHHWLILHGRYICKARTPECWRCPVDDLCRYKPKTPAPKATKRAAPSWLTAMAVSSTSPGMVSRASGTRSIGDTR